MIRYSIFALCLLAPALWAQDPTQITPQSLVAPQTAPVESSAEPKSKVELPLRTRTAESTQPTPAEQDRQLAEIAMAKSRDKAPRRFAEDLFASRQIPLTSTEGGISDDYVLGAGDQVQLNAFGSASFELPLQVDGRGQLVVPKVGSIKVAGMSLAKARAALQAKIAQQFSKTSVELAVLKLREIRVFVLGEVYRPGSYLVPSLSSLVNVLSLSGGPTAAGTYRQIRVIRGGTVVHQIDLYPLRAEGLGNMNFSLQSGDTLFVPLAFTQVTLEGAFTRVVAASGDSSNSGVPLPAVKAGTHVPDNSGLPEWLVRWQKGGEVPTMQFELLPGETVADALHFAGGLALQAFEETLNLRRLGPGGIMDARDIPLARAATFTLQRGDVLSALTSRETMERVVTVTGWVRVPGPFTRTEGLRVGDLLNREAQALPDTYMHRGEIIRTLPDLTTHYLAFDLAKALAGQPDHNLVLEDRDRIELFRTSDFRLPYTVQVIGPLTKAGTFPYREGMRASDLLFQAGIPQNEADRYVAELAHTRDGKPSEVRRLDLAKLLTSEQSSPVQLADESVNPLLKPLDQLSVYSKPEYRPHSTITLVGQVARPGTYVLDSPKIGLREIIARAGGFTPEAMPNAMIFLRAISSPIPNPTVNQEIVATTLKGPALNGIDAILERLNETKRQPTTGVLQKAPVLHGLGNGSLDRLIVNFPAILAGDAKADVDLQDGDQIVIPRRTETSFVIGETASPFMSYHVNPGTKVRDMIKIAGGLTRNADTANIRLLKVDGRMFDSSVMGQVVEPGDAVLIPQKIKRDVTWQESLTALTPIAIMLNAIKLSL